MTHSFLIAVAAEDLIFQEKAIQLSNELQLPIVDFDSKIYSYLIVVTGEKLFLKNTHIKNSKPLFVDFLSPKHQYRQKSNQPELLKKALGKVNSSSALIVDATAGFGEDAFIFASNGYRVIMVERSLIVGALLRDGLTRVQEALKEETSCLPLELVSHDARIYLPQLAKETVIDVVYLDPMFPERKKFALSRKEMEILRLLVGGDDDADGLLDISLQVATNRVIVKRPRLAAPLKGLKPTFSLNGKISRFDVYMVKT